MGSWSIWHWLVVLVVVVLVFGTKKLRNVGGDLGGAIKSFRKGLNDADAEPGKLDAQDKPADPVTRDSTRERSE